MDLGRTKLVCLPCAVSLTTTLDAILTKAEQGVGPTLPAAVTMTFRIDEEDEADERDDSGLSE